MQNSFAHSIKRSEEKYGNILCLTDSSGNNQGIQTDLILSPLDRFLYPNNSFLRHNKESRGLKFFGDPGSVTSFHLSIHDNIPYKIMERMSLHQIYLKICHFLQPFLI